MHSSETQVNGWTLELEGISNATISNSELVDTYVRGFAAVSVYDSSFSRRVLSYDSSRTYIYNSTTDSLSSRQNSRLWLVNSTSNTYSIVDQSEVYVSWYLDVHVVDSISQDVPSANVTATYPNATVAEWRLTDANGWARLTLIEKMMNATDSYPVGNYTVTAKYEVYMGQQSVNMTGNKEITVTLPFIIPEFPPALILPLLMIITLIIGVLSERRKILHKE
ncbi:MAG: carboxypeptidase-like regulatory domain-containing protein [Candidatus Bathyarchaeia archaeon]